MKDLLMINHNRQVYCCDAWVWLKSNRGINAIITSLPDMEEVNMSKDDWIEWLQKTCFILSESLSDGGIIIFYQTDRKYNGEIIDKKSIISRVFFDLGYNNIFNKIVLKQNPETINLFRPTFTNLFGFSKDISTGKATPDVIYAGRMLYKNAMGLNACQSAIDFIYNKIGKQTIVDPFCGQGSVLIIANNMGFDSIGIDISDEQCKKSKNN